MKNLNHVSLPSTSTSSTSSPPSGTNMADDGGGHSFDWTEYDLLADTFPVSSPEIFRDLSCLNDQYEFAPLVEAGNEVLGEDDGWNDVVVEFVAQKGVVRVVEETVEEKGAESMVGAAGSNGQFSPSGWLREQGPVSNGNYGGSLGIHALWEPSFAVPVGNNMGAEWMVGMALTGSKETAIGGSSKDYTFFPFEMVDPVEAPPTQGTVDLGNKRGAEWMVGASPPGAPRGSKRQRSASGSIDTGGGSSDEAMGSEASRELAALGSVCRTKSAWWHKVSSPGYPDADFKRDFHMSRSSFDALCDMLAFAVAKKDMPFRAAVPVPERVAVCVFRLATGGSFRDLQNRFGICSSACHKIVREGVAAISNILQPGNVSALWPDGANAMEDASGKFEALTGGIQGLIGAVYTTHVPVTAPEEDALMYHNRSLTRRRGGKISYTVTLHAAVDADGAFTNLCVGYPGATSDEEIFSLSMSRNRTDEMVAQGKRLAGGAGYPLTDWTLVPYTHSNLTLPQETFNKKVTLARGVALDAFRRLKTRWAILQKLAKWTAMGDLNSVMTACCVLHNFCERRGDKIGDELKGFKLEDDEIVVDNPERSAAAEQVRDEIAQNLLHDW